MAGFENVVSSSGTALTPDQIRLIKRFTKNITILYDGDQAGIMASFRGIDLILEQGMNVRIIMFPPDEDPDSYVRNHRSAETKEFLSQEKDFIRFKTGILLEETKGDPVKKGSLIREIVETIALIPDSIYRNVYIKECSSLLDMPEQTLMNELNKIIRQKFKKEQPYKDAYMPEPEPDKAPLQKDVDYTDSEFQEREIIRLLLQYGKAELKYVNKIEDENKRILKQEVVTHVSKYLVAAISADDLGFKNPVYQMIYEEYRLSLRRDEIPGDGDFINHEMEQVRITAVDLLSSRYELSANWEKNKIMVNGEADKLKTLVDSSLLAFKIKKIELQIADLQEKIKASENDENLEFLLREIYGLKNISQKFNKDLSRIITH
jgi:DNA primase